MSVENNFGNTYEILEELGTGGAGTVYKAYHKRLRTYVALKKIHGNLKNVNSRTEIDILKQLKHTYLPQVYDFIENEFGVYTVIEYIDGKSLYVLMKSGERFSEKEIIKWFKQLCEALEVLHTRKPAIIHGDIKPGNIMLTKTGNICLIDFNVSSVFDGIETQISGYTPDFAAPEQIEYYKFMRVSSPSNIVKNIYLEEFEKTEVLFEEKNSGNNTKDNDKTEILRQTELVESKNIESSIKCFDVRTDIYSLGATIYYLLSGKHPRNKDGTTRNIRNDVPAISESLAHIIEKCLEQNPAERYSSVQEIHKALDNLVFSDQRYKKLIFQQNCIRALLYIGMIVFGFIGVIGYRLMQRESVATYNIAVTKIEEASRSNNIEGVEEAFQEAIRISPLSYDAYQEKARYLYSVHEYDKAEKFIVEEAIPYINSDVGKANLYLILSNCLMEEEDYENAVQILAQAVKEDCTNGEMLCNYAICLAKTHNIEQAELQLSQAIDDGLDEAGLYFVNAEILFEKGSYTEAEENVKKSLALADEQYLKLRGYVLMFDILDTYGTEEALQLKLENIYNAEKVLDETYLLSIWQEKAQTLIDLGEVSNSLEYNEQAIETLKKIIDSGYSTYRTYQNIVILYQLNQRYDEAIELLENMENLFGEDYRTYMYYAYVEVKMQENESISERDYKKFAEYYKNAENLYRIEGATDPEMQNLMDVYEQVEKKGWL